MPIQPVSALTTAGSKNADLDWQIQSNWYLQAVTQCLSTKSAKFPNISQDDAKNGTWFADTPLVPIFDSDTGTAPSGFYMRDTLPGIGDDGKINCNENNNELVQKALAFWGIDGIELGCQSGLLKRANNTDCQLSTNSDLTWSDPTDLGKRAEMLRNYVVSQVYDGKAPNLNDPMRFLLYKRTLQMGCAYGSQPLQTKPGGSNVYEVAQISRTPPPSFIGPPSPGQIFTTPEYYIGDKAPDTGDRWLWTNPNTAKTCGQLADAVKPGSAYAQAYDRWLKDNPTAPEDGKEQPTSPSSDASSCTIPQLGWILCPVLTIGASVADASYGFLADNFLQFRSSLVNTNPSATDTNGNTIGTGTYAAWQIMRNFANVAFIIVFLIIIFSQLTSIGISNYGLKKMLPRLVAAAILVNLSFVICQIAIDLSNILGFSLRNLLAGIADQIKATNLVTTPDGEGNLGGIVLSIIAAATISWIAVGALGIAIVGAVVTLLLIFILLVARQALIVLLVVIAPLAFVAYLLPNTEQWFHKWRKMLTTLLLLFPIIGVVYGAGLLASAVLTQAAGTDVVLKIVAYLALVLPLIAVIPLLKGSLNAVGNIGATLNNLGNKARGDAQKRAQKAYENSTLGAVKKHRAGVRADRRQRMQTGNYRGAGGNFNPRNWVSSANRTLNDNAAFNTATGGFGAQRDLAAQAQARKDMKEAIDMFGSDDYLTEAWASTGGNLQKAQTWIAPDGSSLSQAQLQQFTRMRAAGHHRKATSHLAAAAAMSESGKGNTEALAAALGHAQETGASTTDTDGAWQSALANYRKSGRGDIVGEMNTHFAANGNKAALGTSQLTATAPALAAGREAGWKQVAASSVHREGINATNPAGRASYEAHLGATAENTRQALTGYDSMEARAKSQAQPLILAAAQAHEWAATGVAPTIGSIQDAKAYFNVK